MSVLYVNSLSHSSAVPIFLILSPLFNKLLSGDTVFLCVYVPTLHTHTHAHARTHTHARTHVHAHTEFGAAFLVTCIQANFILPFFSFARIIISTLRFLIPTSNSMSKNYPCRKSKRQKSWSEMRNNHDPKGILVHWFLQCRFHLNIH